MSVCSSSSTCIALESCLKEVLGKNYRQICILLLPKAIPLPKASGSFKLHVRLTIASLKFI